MLLENIIRIHKSKKNLVNNEMAEKINEECLYFLKKDKKNEVNTGFINIRNPFLETINKLSN